jgi:Asp-tRNA(Asn)/Glu-tRNA(Gln) amidotransferase A subunit family amidase
VPKAGDVIIAASLLCQEWHPATPDRGPVLGIPDGPYLSHASSEALTHFDKTCKRLAETGFTIRKIPVMVDFDDIYDSHQMIVAAEAAKTHEAWYTANAILYHPKTAELIERGQAVDDEDLARAREGQLALRQTLGTLMRDCGVDLWLSPSAVGPAPEGLDSTGDPVMNLPWTHAGVPTLTLPSGHGENGLPLGLQLAGDWYKDEDLIAWAPKLEHALRE